MGSEKSGKIIKKKKRRKKSKERIQIIKYNTSSLFQVALFTTLSGKSSYELPDYFVRIQPSHSLDHKLALVQRGLR